MTQRVVSAEQIRNVLDNPDWAAPADRDGAKKYVKKIGTATLNVIVEEESAFTRVVTVFWS